MTTTTRRDPCWKRRLRYVFFVALFVSVLFMVFGFVLFCFVCFGSVLRGFFSEACVIHSGDPGDKKGSWWNIPLRYVLFFLYLFG